MNRRKQQRGFLQRSRKSRVDNDAETTVAWFKKSFLSSQVEEIIHTIHLLIYLFFILS